MRAPIHLRDQMWIEKKKKKKKAAIDNVRAKPKLELKLVQGVAC